MKVLRVGGNVFGDDGMELLMVELQSNNTLADLGIWRCGLTVKSKLLLAINALKIDKRNIVSLSW